MRACASGRTDEREDPFGSRGSRGYLAPCRVSGRTIREYSRPNADPDLDDDFMDPRGFYINTVLKAVLLLTLSVSIEAFWRMPCLSRSGLARLDPLISFGKESSHVHAIHGSSGFSETSTWSDLRAGDCTSCQVSEDKSAYWTPALYFQSTSGEFTLVQQVGGMLAYYLLYPNAGNTSLTAFPQGFQMIAGDTYQRNFTYPVPDLPKSDWTGVYTTQSFLRQAALGFNCLNYAAPAEGSLYRHFLPDKDYLDANCLNGVRFELMFPSCWNGVDVDSADHRSHVAYPSEVMTGDCPEGFSERLVSLFYETIWNTYAFKDQAGTFVLANGDPTGYGYHGDFIMGWDPDFLQSAADQCTNLSGEISDCALFTLQDASVYDNCNLTSTTADASVLAEDVVSDLTALPGNVVIDAGPGYAEGVIAASASPSSAVVPTVSYSAGSTAAVSSAYVPGAVFLEQDSSSKSTSTSSTSTSTSSASTIVTTAPPAAIPAAASQSFFSTEYSTSGLNVLEILWTEEVVTVTQSAPAKRDAKRHLHQHLRHGVA
ncbi:hypothetical protein B7494_g434 [Chlorociboria aeruginascens]|nr:hypothetical protein B7494_g434 [Chlorociboria aeruginascens]